MLSLKNSKKQRNDMTLEARPSPLERPKTLEQPNPQKPYKANDLDVKFILCVFKDFVKLKITANSTACPIWHESMG